MFYKTLAYDSYYWEREGTGLFFSRHSCCCSCIVKICIRVAGREAIFFLVPTITVYCCRRSPDVVFWVQPVPFVLRQRGLGWKRGVNRMAALVFRVSFFREVRLRPMERLYSK